ncbi:acyltransferase [Enterobacter asburiae]|nr:acyltransferase [Enterobacter asburiae]
MRKNNFDILRLALALTVMFFHIGGLTGNEFLKLAPGDLAVKCFFVISGYLISKSYLKNNNIYEYTKSRFLRIYPLYFACVTSCFFIGMLMYSSGAMAYLQDGAAKYLVANLAFLNFIQPDLPGLFADNLKNSAVNGSLWTIKIEVVFYISVPIIYGIFAKSFGKRTTVAAIALLSLISAIAIEIIVDKYGLSESLKNQLPSLMIFFMAGAALNFFTPSFLNVKYLPLLIVALYFCDSHIIGKVIYPFVVAAFVYIIAFKTKPVSIHDKIGDLSYGVYIFHYPVIQFMYQFGAYKNFYIGLISTITTVMILAYMSWHLMEKKLTSHNNKGKNIPNSASNAA